MKISSVIRELEAVIETYGDIEVQLQNTPEEADKPIVGYESFFIVPEEYEGGETVCNIRWWPY